MPQEFDEQLDRLADLLAHRGMQPFFSCPLLTPELRWFPDSWTPDLASARRLLFRFADYCGLRELGIEVGLFTNERQPRWLPPSLASSHQESGAAALFMGLHDDTAYFGVESEALSDPSRLPGILAHEMAHAWRAHHKIAAEDRQREEELTDLTTVVLGWGILTSNVAYQFQSSGGLRGGRVRTQTSHRWTGYLPVEIMSALLAVYAVARGEDTGRIRRHLGATQKDAFQSALRWLEEEDLDLGRRLALPPENERAFPEIETAPEVDVPLSRAGVKLHAAIARLVEDLGDDGGILESAPEFPAGPYEERHTTIATWGRAGARGGWWRRIQLVSDPEWTVNAIVVQRQDEEAETLALGHVPDEICARKRDLEKFIEPLFEPGSPHARHLIPEVPGLVAASDASVLGISELERLFLRAMARFEPSELAAETSWLGSFGSKVRQRLAQEPREGAAAPKAANPKESGRAWWRLVSDPAQARAEWDTLVQMRKKAP